MRRETLQNDLYADLKRAAGLFMRGEGKGNLLTTTALVHEAYLRLGNSFVSKEHFYAAAAQAMRRVLVDAARARMRLKRGAGAVQIELSEVQAPVNDDRLIALDEALQALALRNANAAEVVQLHHFAGLSHEDVASTLKITVYEARQLWSFARAWLKISMSEFFSTDESVNDA